MYRRIIVANVAPNAPNVLRVTYIQNYGAAVNIYNRGFYTFTGSVDSTVATTVANLCNTAWTQHISPLVSTTYVLDTVVVTDLTSPGAVQEVLPSGAAGSLPAADFLAAGTCMMFTATINRRYRGGKPRWYQTGQHQASLQDNQTWASTPLGNWVAGFNLFMKGPVGAVTNGGTVTGNVNLSLVQGYTWVEYTTSSGKTNYRKDPVYRASAVTDPIIDWKGAPRVASQRKRNVN